ncbi:Mitochondrial antiviral-signaling protein [Calypte anna]|uniref:Mitochondrial antiviral-signaling protein n=1 Tax=Calypte anna TaxID=9244 RepID=A0A091HXJ7_CALAN|nr:Mitochondrial antiviral-signaling protein [Calypte anna]
MGFAEDKVYNHILENLSKFKNIRVASLADSLRCLTDADRDELHAREETRGSHATVYKFYQLLRCRQGWVSDLISALRQNNAGHLADELQHVYDAWKPRRLPPAPTAASFPPATSSARPATSSSSAQKPSPGSNPVPAAPLAEPHQDLPRSGHSHLLPSAATTTTDLDARVPVQELLPKNHLEQESPQPPLPKSDGQGREEHLPHTIKTPQVAVGTPGAGNVAVPPAAPLEQGWDWLSCQQHPVCVDNGCFGNANHLHRGAPGLGLGRSLPPRDVGAAHSPEQPKNEPQEDSYISTESPPRLEEEEEVSHGRRLQPPDSAVKKPSVTSSGHSEPPGSFVDVRSPLLIQQQFEEEQKLRGMQREHGADGGTGMEMVTPVPTPAPGDVSAPSDTSVKPPVQERELPNEAASSTTSTLTQEKVGSVDPVPSAARSSEGTTGRRTSWVSSSRSIWSPWSNTERDVEFSKPGVLSMSRESPEVAGRSLSPPGDLPPSSFTLSSDQLMVSTDSWSSGDGPLQVSSGFPAPVAPEDPRGGEAAGAPLPNWNSTSLHTYEVLVDHYPSTQLGAGGNLQDGDNSLRNPSGPDSSRGCGTASSSSQARIPPGDSNGPSLPYILPAVGIAVISAVAFPVYTRLQK